VLRHLAAALAALTILAPAAQAAPAAGPVTLPLAEAVDQLPESAEDRTGYDRDLFKHWNAGLKRDGCDTRKEILISEAVEAPRVGARCKITGGSWWSYYDERTQTDVADLDIDHMVPLAEAWDSGASGWTAARREAYANDQGAEESLIAVTDRVNQAKGDQDPAEWLPPAEGALCRYLSEWVGMKLRWELTADDAETDTLRDLVGECARQTVTYEVAE
jgi:hypothetical protein